MHAKVLAIHSDTNFTIAMLAKEFFTYYSKLIPSAFDGSEWNFALFLNASEVENKL